jgi:peroxiredoxin
MKGFQAGIKNFNEAESQILGISVDAAPSLKRFSDDLQLEFPLLSDFPNRNTAKAYGVLMAERGIASRTTFVIDKDGKIVEIIADGRPAPHNEASIAACQRIKK